MEYKHTLFVAILGLAISEARDLCFVCPICLLKLFKYITELQVQTKCRALFSLLKVLTYIHSYSNNRLPRSHYFQESSPTGDWLLGVNDRLKYIYISVVQSQQTFRVGKTSSKNLIRWKNSIPFLDTRKVYGDSQKLNKLVLVLSKFAGGSMGINA